VSRRIVCLGECMVELTPAGDALYRRGFAGGTFNAGADLVFRDHPGRRAPEDRPQLSAREPQNLRTSSTNAAEGGP